MTKVGRLRGPGWLFIAWVLHDIEEAAAFPETCDYLADRTGIDAFRMNTRQSWAAVGLMGLLVGFACVRGARTGGRSRLYRAVVAGLETHTFTHIAASLLTRRYTAGVITAVPVMLPAARAARKQLAVDGDPLSRNDETLGIILLPAAGACHIIVRMVMRRHNDIRRTSMTSRAVVC